MFGIEIFYLFLIIFLKINSIKCNVNAGYIIHDILRNDHQISKNYIINQVENDGYKIETHTTVTPDGYILTLHRIPNSFKTKCKNKSQLPVYIHHGLLLNADSWIIAGNRSLPYTLADAGYDVWLGNARGSTHSRAHKNLNPNSYGFWDFTWHEIGIYDNPTNIDYILNVTKQKQLHYIGHSQGTTSFFVMTSLKPEYNNKIKTMQALSPVAYMKYTTSPFFKLSNRFLEFLTFFAKYFGFSELLPNSILVKAFQNICNVTNPRMNICRQIFFSIGGYNEDQFEMDYLLKLVSVTPAGAGIFQLLHYAQNIRTGKFQSFDYGIDENIRRYGQKSPIQYPLDKITAPLYLYVSPNDFISDLKDVNLFINGLRRKPVYKEVKDKKWNHFDYVIGKDAKELVYNLVLNDMYTADKLDLDNCKSWGTPKI